MSTTTEPTTNPFGRRSGNDHVLISDTPQRARPSRWWKRRRRVRDPRIHAALLVILFVGAIVGTISSATGAARSAYTQDHGVAASATLGYVSNRTSCGRYSCSTTFSAPVTLASPVDGQVTSTLHGAGRYDAVDGNQVDVLVDPKDPSYAELPGYPLDGSSSWVLFGAGSLFFGAGLLLAVRRLLRTHPGLLPRRFSFR